MQLLTKFGITKKGMMNDEFTSSIAFSVNNVAYRVSILTPDINTKEFMYDGRNSRRTPVQQKAAWDAENRRRWRSLVLVMKAKLVAIEDKITTFEEEFLAHAVTDDGRTVYERLAPQLSIGGPLALGVRSS